MKISLAALLVILLAKSLVGENATDKSASSQSLRIPAESRIIFYAPRYNHSGLDLLMTFLGNVVRSKELLAHNMIDLKQKLACVDCGEDSRVNQEPVSTEGPTSSTSLRPGQRFRMFRKRIFGAIQGRTLNV